MFYSCEVGMGATATYLAVIETTKMHSLEVRGYLVHAFREIMNGNKDCSMYAPKSFLI